MLAAPLILIIIIIIIALIFDFTNGFHDSANSISTVVSTKVLSPRNAVAFAAFFNFVAAFGFGVLVASTISRIIKLDFVNTELIPYIVLSALIGAINWNLITWFFGLPTSSSHALIGGMIGAGISAAGLAAVAYSGFSGAMNALTSGIPQPEHRAGHFTLLGFCMIAANSGVPVLTGCLFDHVSYRGGFTILSALSVGVVVFCAWLLRDLSARAEDYC